MLLFEPGFICFSLSFFFLLFPLRFCFAPQVLLMLHVIRYFSPTTHRSIVFKVILVLQQNTFSDKPSAFFVEESRIPMTVYLCAFSLFILKSLNHCPETVILSSKTDVPAD